MKGHKFILLVILTACNGIFAEKSVNTTIITPTNTVSNSPTIRSTNKVSTIEITNEITRTYPPTIQTNLLPSLQSGRYLVYTYHKIGSDQYELKIVSEKGQEIGKITEGGAEYRSYLSTNQMYIAYSIFNQVIIYTIGEGQSVALPDKEGCFDGVVEMSWNPDNSKLAITCGTIVIISIIDGNKLGEISRPINNTIHGNHIKPNWSPDGKWIAYFVQYGPQYGTQGPFISDTSCITNEGVCKNITRSFEKTSDNDNALLAWTPSNHLAVVDPQENLIHIYNVESSSLIRTFKFPETIHWVASLTWSPDEEWIALGSDEGLSIMSIETGEVKHISIESNIVNFWYVVS